MSMNRRSFLKALGILAAASQVPVQLIADEIAPATPVAPVIDWTAWNTIEAGSVNGVVKVLVNSLDVTPYPDLVTKACSLFSVEEDGIRFSPAGHASMGGGFKAVIPELVPDTFRLGFRYRETPDCRTASSFYVDDLYVMDGAPRRTPLGYDKQNPTVLIPNGEDTRIDSVMPRYGSGEGYVLSCDDFDPYIPVD